MLNISLRVRRGWLFACAAFWALPLPGNAAVAPEPAVIREVIFDRTIMRMGSGDNWHTTWAKDDHQYTAMGDGGGTAPADTRWNTRVFRLRGTPPAHSLELLPDYPRVLEPVQHWYGYGLIAIGDHLYHFVSYLAHGQWHGAGPLPSRFRGTRLVHSPNLGGHWQFADGQPMDFTTPLPQKMFFWDLPDLTFSLPSILQYGRNYEWNEDGYVYVYAPNGFTEGKMNQLVMARVPKDKILDPASYEFFVARDGHGGASWSPELRQRGVVHTFPVGWVGSGLAYSWHPYVVFNEPLNLYLMAAGGTGRNGSFTLSEPSSLGIYTAQQPWGPWTSIYSTNKWINDSVADRLYEPVVPPKWISEDGKTFYLVHSNSRGSFSKEYYLFNVQKVTLITEAPLPRLEIQRSGGNALITWPSNFDAFTLETAKSVSSEPWAPLPDRSPTTAEFTEASSFYRLRRVSTDQVAVVQSEIGNFHPHSPGR